MQQTCGYLGQKHSCDIPLLWEKYLSISTFGPDVVDISVLSSQFALPPLTMIKHVNSCGKHQRISNSVPVIYILDIPEKCIKKKKNKLFLVYFGKLVCVNEL